MQKFTDGWKSTDDEHRVGLPVVIAIPAKYQRVEVVILADRRVTIDAVATAIGCSRDQQGRIKLFGAPRQ